jgi:hypothetical protein
MQGTQIQFAPNQLLLEEHENPIECSSARRLVSPEDIAVFEWHYEAMDVYGVEPRSLSRVGCFVSEGDITPAMAMVSRLRRGGGIDMLVHTDVMARFATAFISEGGIFYSRDSQGNNVDFDTFWPFEGYDSLNAKLGGKYAQNSLWKTHDKSRVIAGNLLLGNKPRRRYDAVTAFFVEEVLSGDPKDLLKAVRNKIEFVEPGGFFAAAYVESPSHRTPGGIIIDLAGAERDRLYDVYDKLCLEGVIDDFMLNVIPASGQLRPDWDPCEYSNVIHVAGRKKK